VASRYFFDSSSWPIRHVDSAILGLICATSSKPRRRRGDLFFDCPVMPARESSRRQMAIRPLLP
jgi:hypothetical protein